MVRGSYDSIAQEAKNRMEWACQMNAYNTQAEKIRAENGSDFSLILLKLRYNCSQALWYNLNK